MTDTTQILQVYKPEGLTPLQLIEVLKVKRPELKNMKMSYAGRLDPMAEGLMLLVAGEQSIKESLLHLDKVYEFQMLMGIETDTHDVLGLIQQMNDSEGDLLSSVEIQQLLPSLLGKQDQVYPAYSSKTVNGKALFTYARANTLDRIIIPTREIEIYSLELNNSTDYSKTELRERIFHKISKVEGDFRQDEIVDKWSEYLSITKRNSFTVVSLSIHASSGTYVRSLVHNIGTLLGCGAVTWSILRKNIGNYSILDSNTIYL